MPHPPPPPPQAYTPPPPPPPQSYNISPFGTVLPEANSAKSKQEQRAQLQQRIAELEHEVDVLDRKLRSERIEVDGKLYEVPLTMSRRPAEDPLYQRIGQEYHSCSLRATHFRYTYIATLAALPLSLFLRRRGYIYGVVAAGALTDLLLTWRECHRYNHLLNLRLWQMNKAEIEIERELVHINEKVWYSDLYKRELFGDEKESDQ